MVIHPHPARHRERSGEAGGLDPPPRGGGDIFLKVLITPTSGRRAPLLGLDLEFVSGIQCRSADPVGVIRPITEK